MKKIKTAEKKAGIWLDQEKAFIIRIEGEGVPVLEKIKSGVEIRIRNPGEGKSFARFGRAFIDDQEKKQNRQVQQRRRFFKEITGLVQDADYIYLFGPGEAKEGLNNEIEKGHSVKGKVVAIEAAGRLSQNKLIEKTISFFNDDVFKKIKKELRKEKA
jgi:hypothetical protein